MEPRESAGPEILELVKVRIEIGSLLRRHVPAYDAGRGLERDVEAGLTAAELIERLGIPLEDVEIITVNRRTVESGYVLRENDKVGLFSALVGG